MLVKPAIRGVINLVTCNTRSLSTSNVNFIQHSCRVLIVGGGSGGCAVAAKFARNLKKDEVFIVEPSDTHYYQPYFTLVGGGIKNLRDAGKPMKSILPSNAKWVQDSVAEFNPKTNIVVLKNGDTVKYDIILIGVGLKLHYEKVPGLVEALSIPGGEVCSNYSPKYVERTFQALQKFKSGNAIFTYPNSPVKCPGAPQKICYISEHYLRKVGKRDQATVIYNSSLPVIFGVKTYADALWKVVEKRNIKVNLRTNLIEVQPDKKIAIFENLDKPEEKLTFEYSMLHVTPPMGTPNELKSCKDLVNEAGFVEVNKDTMQHVRFPNVFAIGDCSSSPNSKTAASAAAQSPVVFENMKSLLSGKKLDATYDGYASCPLVTGYGSCILAEFDYSLQPLETFPIRQDREMLTMYLMKKDFMSPLYWNLMMNGYWNGPKMMRKILHLNMGR